MERKYYKCGLRPVIQEIYSDYKNYLAMNWETGIFEQNFRYSHQIFMDPSGDVEELTKSEFDAYVKQLREEAGFESSDG